MLLFRRSFEYLIDLLVLHAYQAHVANVRPGKPAAANDAAALDAVLGKFLELLQCLQDDSHPIIRGMHYTRHTAEQVMIGTADDLC